MLKVAIFIGHLADRTGLAVSAIRYYETQGLVSPERNAGGQRRFLRRTRPEDRDFNHPKRQARRVHWLRVSVAQKLCALQQARQGGKARDGTSLPYGRQALTIVGSAEAHQRCRSNRLCPQRRYGYAVSCLSVSQMLPSKLRSSQRVAGQRTGMIHKWRKIRGELLGMTDTK